MTQKAKKKGECPIKKRYKTGNLIYYKKSNGFEAWSEYDSKGNEISYKCSNGEERWTEGERVLELKDGKYYLDDEEMEASEVIHNDPHITKKGF